MNALEMKAILLGLKSFIKEEKIHIKVLYHFTKLINAIHMFEDKNTSR